MGFNFASVVSILTLNAVPLSSTSFRTLGSSLSGISNLTFAPSPPTQIAVDVSDKLAMNSIINCSPKPHVDGVGCCCGNGSKGFVLLKCHKRGECLRVPLVWYVINSIRESPLLYRRTRIHNPQSLVFVPSVPFHVLVGLYSVLWAYLAFFTSKALSWPQ